MLRKSTTRAYSGGPSRHTRSATAYARGRGGGSCKRNSTSLSSVDVSSNMMLPTTKHRNTTIKRKCTTAVVNDANDIATAADKQQLPQQLLHNANSNSLLLQQNSSPLAAAVAAPADAVNGNAVEHDAPQYQPPPPAAVNAVVVTSNGNVLPLDRFSLLYPLMNSSLSTTHDGEQCIICHEDYKSGDWVRRLNCFHLFHSHCIENWLSRQSSCPVCQYEFKWESIED